MRAAWRREKKEHIKPGELFLKKDRAKILIFLLIAFVLPLVLSPLVKQRPGMDESFAVYMMILPTFGIVAGRVFVQKKISGWFQWIYVIAFVVYSIVMIFGLAGILTGDMADHLQVVLLVFSFALFLAGIIDEQELYPFQNMKKVLGIYFLFLLINLSIPAMLQGEIDASYVAEFFALLFVNPLRNLVLGGIYLLGEEYAWRGCLMGKLQGLFGKRLGVIWLGMIWELWHIPLWFTCFDLTHQDVSFGIMVLLRLLHTMGLAVFIGWAYMKTDNIWVCALLHGGNNGAALGMTTVDTTSDVADPMDVIFLIICSLVLLAFLFTKEYRCDRIINRDEA